MMFSRVVLFQKTLRIRRELFQPVMPVISSLLSIQTLKAKQDAMIVAIT